MAGVPEKANASTGIRRMLHPEAGRGGNTMRSMILGLTVLVGFAVGCAADLNDPYHQRDRLQVTQKEFSQYLRWGAIEKASQFVVEEQRDEFKSLAPHLTDLRITDYEVMKVEQRSDTEALVVVRYVGYSLSSPIERSIVLDQTWTRVPETDFWMVSLEVNRLREALGLAAR